MSVSTAISTPPPALPPGFAAAAAPAQAELRDGLSRPQALIAPKYFYDALGSTLFEAICRLDEYYLTRAEAAIFSQHGEQIAQVAGTGRVMVDLGAGNCEKAANLFGLLKPLLYVPVDISAAFLTDAVAGLRQRHAQIQMLPLGLDFSESFTLPPPVANGGPKTFFYPGSSIGNFTPLQAAQFLARLRAAAATGDGLLIGVDVVKPAARLVAAYDDGLGVTAAFNLNVLRHVNQLLGSDFEPRHWRHVALYNAAHARVEMYLQARQGRTVNWPGGVRRFEAGERIHTENSYKYTSRGFVDLLQQSGFAEPTCWSDPAADFLLVHARAT